MSNTVKDYRLDGIYRQRQDGFFMQRVKLAAGVIPAVQARAVAAISTRFGRGTIHLTTRGSMEIHWLKETDLPEVKRALASVGLTSRGACGGAVRGITCSSQGAVGFPAVETMARRLHRHFTANPRFERLPKKFKIGVETNAAGRRHLIQDIGLVLSGYDEECARYDLFAAGGLGREPQPGFLFEAGVSENRIIPLIEAIARVYAAHTPAGKRLKHLVRSIDENEFRRLVALEPSAAEELPEVSGLQENLIQISGNRRMSARIYAGCLTGDQLIELADFAELFADGLMMVTAEQEIAFHVTASHNPAEASAALSRCAFNANPVSFRVCPGSHECRMGLSATRNVAQAIIGAMGPAGRTKSWALSGCHNSCTQPQLADIGIVSSSLAKDDSGERSPRFDLLLAGSDVFGTVTERSLTLDELCSKVREIG
ncbi:MAG: nitrite/sulfite reductase [Desulfuromonadales bacterium]|nr:nitrite/sulfite reductase [Desulfuromonadales bacterium]